MTRDFGVLFFASLLKVDLLIGTHLSLYPQISYMDNGFKRYCLPLKFKGYDGNPTYLIPYEKFVEVNSKYKINEEGWYNKCSIPYC